ncbi:MobF family relaxase [Nocardia sp. alder85J]|uniref:MobF family relaxase n=1 Tax=Nocardia sp. alder85J TaxID=2862949 RepID=UPI001CD68685|nr:MobF family relaxase [Nocardia sp. alder85J]MCX4094561.1 relaxase domain-containing protein [Nocardia sp. alder85J]
MTATIHKLAAGSGYTYLTKQVAKHDATTLGKSSLEDYYSSRGESPGQWMGSGMAALGIAPGTAVTETQMRALFGEGRHPDADAMQKAILAEHMAQGTSREVAAQIALKATELGIPYRIPKPSSEFRQKCAVSYGEYNQARGQPWKARIADEERAQIRTAIATEMFTAEYDRPSSTDRELSGWVARNSRTVPTSVAGFDVTFSPVKSVSTLWAVAPRPIARTIEAAHHAAIGDALTYLEKHVARTRLGANGVAQVDVEGLVAAAFDHRDSRAGDPDLHTHFVIANRVRTADGLWRTLDARMLYRALVTVSEIYNTRLEMHLQATLGLEFAERPGRDPRKRPVREIIGVAPELNRRWSRRDELIVARLGELSTLFQLEHGREPTAEESYRLSQRAILETRDPKHEPRSLAEQRAAWRAEARALLGGDEAIAAMVAAALHPASVPRPVITPQWIATLAGEVIDTVSLSRATWQVTHVRSEVERRVRGRVDPGQWDTVTADVVAAALGPDQSIPRREPDMFTDPGLLRRRSGASVFTVEGATQYTSAEVLAAEYRLVAAAKLTGGRTLSPTVVDIALLEFDINNNPDNTDDRKLTAGQIDLVREFALSGNRFQLAIAPAGTGKTTAMQVLANAWRSEGGNVLGLAPTASAAAVLGQDIHAPVHTIDKLTHTLNAVLADGGAKTVVPPWMHDIGPGTLVIIDEIGKAGTRHLDHAVTWLLARGATVRGIGDDQQLTSVAAGGVVRDIAETVGALSLSHVIRFPDRTEGAASLALRDGDPAAIAFYLDKNRVRSGDTATVADLAYTAWNRDRATGNDAVMLAPTHDLVQQLNQRARADRLAADGTPDPDREVDLADGLHASVGDTICTRRNDPRLTLAGNDYVRNGYRWQVVEIHTDGSLTASHLASHRRVRLPADYLTSDTTLGYASTIDTAQGVTAHTCHAVFTPSVTRNQLYVAATRGKHGNTWYVTTTLDGTELSLFTDLAAAPPTAVDLLTDILAHDGAQKSATTAQRDAFNPHTRLGPLADTYSYALGAAAEHRAGPATMAAIDSGAENLHPGLTSAPAWPTLRKHLALLAVDDRDPVTELAAAIARRPLEDDPANPARDPAAVLDWRLDETGGHSTQPGPLPWLPGIPDTLRDDPEFGPSLTGRATRVRELAGHVGRDSARWTPATAPLWARPIAGRHLPLLADLAVWRAAQRVPDNDRRPTGPQRYRIVERRCQRRLDERLTRILGDLTPGTARWAPTVQEIDPRIVSDSFWPVLAERLDLADRAGLNVTALLRHAAGQAPLPDELPAAALWWRLHDRIGTAALDTGLPAGRHSSPEWITTLRDLLGPEIAEHVMASPSWPHLVAALEEADPDAWAPQPLLASAVDLLTSNQPGDLSQLRPDEIATALAWRVEAIHRHTDLDPTTLPPEPADPELLDPLTEPGTDRPHHTAPDNIGATPPATRPLPPNLPPDPAQTPANPLQQIPTAELEEHIRLLTSQIASARSALDATTFPKAPTATEQFDTRRTNLARAHQAILAARAAADARRATENALSVARKNADQLRTDTTTGRRSDRRAATAALAEALETQRTLETGVATARATHAEAQRLATLAAGPAEHWDIVMHEATDPDQRTTDLAAAHLAAAERRERQHREDKRTADAIARLERRLTDAQAEQTRRDDLSAEQLAVEDQDRTPSSRQESASPVPPNAISSTTPDRADELGL